MATSGKDKRCEKSSCTSPYQQWAIAQDNILLCNSYKWKQTKNNIKIHKKHRELNKELRVRQNKIQQQARLWPEERIIQYAQSRKQTNIVYRIRQWVQNNKRNTQHPIEQYYNNIKYQIKEVREKWINIQQHHKEKRKREIHQDYQNKTKEKNKRQKRKKKKYKHKRKGAGLKIGQTKQEQEVQQLSGKKYERKKNRHTIQTQGRKKKKKKGRT